MPQPIELSRYPANFLKLAERIEQHKQSISLPCTSASEAKALRLKLYGFVRALKREGVGAQFPTFLSCSFRVEENKCLVVPADESFFALAIDAALDEAGASSEKGEAPDNIKTAQPQLAEALSNNTEPEAPLTQEQLIAQLYRS